MTGVGVGGVGAGDEVFGPSAKPGRTATSGMVLARSAARTDVRTVRLNRTNITSPLIDLWTTGQHCSEL